LWKLFQRSRGLLFAIASDDDLWSSARAAERGTYVRPSAMKLNIVTTLVVVLL
jgi:hypothetical protein